MAAAMIAHSLANVTGFEEILVPEVFNGVGVVALFGWLFWMLATGRLVTRRENNATIADRDMWRDTAQTLTPVVTKVLTEAETTNRLLRALPRLEDEKA